MNVLIIATNHHKQPMIVMPYGACVIAEEAQKAGHEISFLDLMFAKNPHQAVTDKLAEIQPQIVGLSVRNIDNNDMMEPLSFTAELILLVKLIRQKSKAVIVLGGGAVTIMASELLEHSGADYTISGNGEKSFVELLSCIDKETGREKVPGLGRLENGHFKKNAISDCQSYIRCYTPNYQHWLNLISYQVRAVAAPLQTKRGCPYKCVYCTYGQHEGKEYQLSSPESVVEAIKYLSRQGIKDIEFVDNVFNSPYDHAVAICEKLAKVKLKVRLQTMELNPAFIDENLIEVMNQAGFVGAGITAESVADSVLNSLGKNYTSRQIYAAAKALQSAKFACVWMFMLGGPGETKKTVKQTLEFAQNYIRPKDLVFFNMGIRIYPRTDIEKVARNQGLLNFSSSQMIKPVFYFSPSLDKNWLTKTLQQSINKHLNFIGSKSLSLPFLDKLSFLGVKLGLKPPLWRHALTLRHGLRLIGVKI